MSDRPDENDVRLRVYGSNAATGALEAAPALVRLLDAVTQEVAPEAKVRWEIDSISLQCDGCGTLAPSLIRPADWTNDGTNDYCADCTRDQRA